MPCAGHLHLEWIVVVFSGTCLKWCLNLDSPCNLCVLCVLYVKDAHPATVFISYG